MFVDDMIVRVENCQGIYKNILKLISGFSKHMGYRINTQKSIVFLYDSNEPGSSMAMNKVIPPVFT